MHVDLCTNLAVLRGMTRKFDFSEEDILPKHVGYAYNFVELVGT